MHMAASTHREIPLCLRYPWQCHTLCKFLGALHLSWCSIHFKLANKQPSHP